MTSAVLGNRPLPSAMADLAAAKATGSLVAMSGGARREVLFTNGEIRAARSQNEDEKLGMWLVQRGKISEDDRALILLAQGGGDSPPLGHILVTRDYISADELEEELQELALTIIGRAAEATGTRCEFVDGGGEGQLDTLPNVVTSQIILLAARKFTDLEAMRRVIGPVEQTVDLSGSLKDMLEEVELTPTEGFLISRLDGAKDVADLIQLSSLPEVQAYQTIYSLVLSGTVIVGAGNGSQSAGEGASPDTPVIVVEGEEDGETVEITDEPGGEADFTPRQIEERKYIRKMSETVTKVDHYKALGLGPEANPADIKEGWKKIEERFSPTSIRGTHLKDMVGHLERIVERGRAAYEVLSDYKGRQRYDQILKSMNEERRPAETPGRGEVDPKARKELVEANLKRADELIRDDELYLAIQLLERACALDPRPDELLKLSRLLQRNPLWTNRALTCLRRAIEADPKHVESWLELADFWRRRNHSERQRKSLERALAVDPNNETANRLYKDLVGSKELQRLLKRARQMR